MAEDKDIEQIRREKAAKLLAAMDSDNPEERKAVHDAMPWSIAVHKDRPDTYELRLEDATIALTQSEEWAMMVVELLNRLVLAEHAGVGWP